MGTTDGELTIQLPCSSPNSGRSPGGIETSFRPSVILRIPPRCAVSEGSPHPGGRLDPGTCQLSEDDFSYKRIWIGRGAGLKLVIRLQINRARFAFFPPENTSDEQCLIDFIAGGISSADCWQHLGLSPSLSVVKPREGEHTNTWKMTLELRFREERVPSTWTKTGALRLGSQPKKRRKRLPAPHARPWDVQPPAGVARGELAAVEIGLVLGSSPLGSIPGQRLLRARSDARTTSFATSLARQLDGGLKSIFAQKLAVISPTLFCPGYRDDVAERSRWVGRIAGSLANILGRERRMGRTPVPVGDGMDCVLHDETEAYERGDKIQADLWMMMQKSCYDGRRAGKLSYFSNTWETTMGASSSSTFATEQSHGLLLEERNSVVITNARKSHQEPAKEDEMLLELSNVSNGYREPIYAGCYAPGGLIEQPSRHATSSDTEEMLLDHVGVTTIALPYRTSDRLFAADEDIMLL